MKEIPVTHTIVGCNSQEELIRVIFLIIYIGVEICQKTKGFEISNEYEYPTAKQTLKSGSREKNNKK